MNLGNNCFLLLVFPCTYFVNDCIYKSNTIQLDISTVFLFYYKIIESSNLNKITAFWLGNASCDKKLPLILKMPVKNSWGDWNTSFGARNGAHIHYKYSFLLTWPAMLAKRPKAHHLKVAAIKAPLPSLTNQHIPHKTRLINLSCHFLVK